MTSVLYCIVYKLLLIYKALSGAEPCYFSDLLNYYTSQQLTVGLSYNGRRCCVNECFFFLILDGK